MAGSDDIESTVEVTLDGSQWQPGCDRDFWDVHFLQKSQEEDRALTWREVGDRLPYELDLLLGEEERFRGSFAAGDASGNVGDVDCGVGNVLPESETACAGVITGEVEGDSDQPGSDGTVFAEAGSRGPCVEEGLLGKRFGCVAITQVGQ